MKVPELKKLLNERSLPQTGNKADLIARLQEHDKQQAKPADAAPGQFSSIRSSSSPWLRKSPSRRPAITNAFQASTLVPHDRYHTIMDAHLLRGGRLCHPDRFQRATHHITHLATNIVIAGTPVTDTSLSI